MVPRWNSDVPNAK